MSYLECQLNVEPNAPEQSGPMVQRDFKDPSPYLGTLSGLFAHPRSSNEWSGGIFKCPSAYPAHSTLPTASPGVFAHPKWITCSLRMPIPSSGCSAPPSPPPKTSIPEKPQRTSVISRSAPTELLQYLATMSSHHTTTLIQADCLRQAARPTLSSMLDWTGSVPCLRHRTIATCLFTCTQGIGPPPLDLYLIHPLPATYDITICPCSPISPLGVVIIRDIPLFLPDFRLFDLPRNGV